MKHRPVLSTAGLTLAAVLLLGACSSGTASAPGSTVGSSGAAASSSAAPTTAPSTGAAPSTASSTAPSTTDSRLITGTTSVSLSSRVPRSTPTAPSPSGTAAVDTFSPDTVRFFTSLCSGLAARPADRLDQLTGSTAERRVAASRLFEQQASALRGAVTGMKVAGPPDIPDGEVLFKAVLVAYPRMADAAAKGATVIAKTSGQSDLAEAIEQARQDTTDAAAPLAAVDDVVGAPAVAERLRGIPSCVSVLRN